MIRTGYNKDDKERLADLAKIKKEVEVLQGRLSNAQNLVLDGALDGSESKQIKAKLEPELQKLKYRMEDLKAGNTDEQELVDFGFDFLKNLAERFTRADLEGKRKILGSKFPERLIFENGKCRTPENENILLLIASPGARSAEKKKRNRVFSCAFQRSGAGGKFVEPFDDIFLKGNCLKRSIQIGIFQPITIKLNRGPIDF